MSGDVAISVQGVSKSFRVFAERNQSIKGALLRGRSRYEEFMALDDINLTVPRGKTFGLLGNNGSGKSTLLKCMARILEPNTGVIKRKGRIAAMLEVGSGFHPELTGRENVYLNSAILGMTRSEIESKFPSIIDFAGDAVARAIDQPVKNYSSGMYVRLGFSVSIHVEPDILLVDEVLAVGDMEFQEKCMEKFADFKRAGRTVVVVSHGLELMRTFCDEAAWLDKGKVAKIGTADSVINHYTEKELGAVPVEGGGVRYGVGTVMIDRLEVLADNQSDPDVVHSYDPIRIRIHFTAKEAVSRPSFIVSLDHIDGPVVWANHTKDMGFVPEDVQPGPGSLDVVIPGLALRAGRFHINASVHAENSAVLSALNRSRELRVGPADPVETAGVVALGSYFDRLEPPRPMADPTKDEL